MYENFIKCFKKLLIILFLVFLGLYLYGSYLVSHVTDSEELTIISFISLYIFGYFSFMTFISLIRKLDSVYIYSILLFPFTLVIFYAYYLINNPSLDLNNLSVTYFHLPYVIDLYFPYIGVYGIIKITFLYIGLLVFTKIYTDLLSDKIFQFIIGKQINEKLGSELGDDFSYISIYPKKCFVSDDYKLELVKNIIKNLLGYKVKDHKVISYQNKKYEIFKFSRTKYSNLHRYKDTILLLPMDCIDINYLQLLKNLSENENSPEEVQLTNLDVKDYDLYKNKSKILDDILYKCYFIKQYHESEDKIENIKSIYNETYLALANILFDEEKFINYSNNNSEVFNAKMVKTRTVNSFLCFSESLITVFKNDTIIPEETWKLKDSLFSQYIYENYGTLLDKFGPRIYIKFKTKNLKIIGIFSVFLVLLSFIIFDFVTAIAIIGSISGVVSTIILLIDKLK